MLSKNIKKTLSSVFFIGLLTALSSCNATEELISEELATKDLPASCPHLSNKQLNLLDSAIVDWIPDGDTIHTRTKQKLRLLHINTPEINPKSKKPAEPYALQAKKQLTDLVGTSKKIYWSTDARNKDKYGRLLVWIYDNKGQSINASLVNAGYAHALIIPPNQQHWQCIRDAESLARQNKRGIWSHANYQPKNVSQLKANQGFQLIQGRITKIENTAKTRWLLLDDRLWINIPQQDLPVFNEQQIKFSTGAKLVLRGYVYQSKKGLSLKLQHPAMLLENN